MTVISDSHPPGLLHDAMFYDSVESYREGVLRFVLEGMERGEPVLVAVPEPGLSLLRAELDLDDAGVVRTADMAVEGRNPGRIIGSVLTPFVREHPGQRVRIVGEPLWAGRSEEEYLVCVEHEALINVALADSPVSVLCPYDATRLSPSVLTDSTRTHPVLANGPDRWPSPAYTDPAAVAASFDRTLPPPPPEAGLLVVTHDTGPHTARHVVHEFAERAGMKPDRIADLRRIVQELTVNTIVHSGGAGLLSVWEADEHVVIQMQDGGRIGDPLAGRRPPETADTGHGLFVVHKLADLVRVHRGVDGTTVRVHVAIG